MQGEATKPDDDRPSRVEEFIDEARDDVERKVRPVIAALTEKRARHKQRHIVVRGLYLVIAATILLLGLIMLITPGPAFVLIPVGLTLLALEFASAERLLDRALEQGEKAKEKAANTTKTQRILGITATVLFVAAAAVAIVYWELWEYLPF